MQSAGLATNRLSGQAIGTHRALTIMRGGLLNLASSASAIPGPIGRISLALAGMQLAMGPLLAITAVLAAGALAWKHFSDVADTAAKNVVSAAERMRRGLEDFIGAHAQEGLPSQQGLAILQARLVEAQAQLAKMRQPVSIEEVLGEGPIVRTTAAITAQENWVVRLTNAIDILKQRLHELRVTELQQAALDAAVFAKEMAKVNTAVEVTASKILVPLRAKRGLGEMAKGPGKGFVDTLLPGEAEFLRLQEQDLQRLNRLGASVGRTIMLGVIEGMQSMQDILKSIFLQILDFAIGAILGGLFGGPAGAVVGGLGAKNSGGIAKSVVSPASMAVTMNMSGLQPLTAFAIARDPGFQHVIRESILVAGAAGFKGGR